MLTNGVSVKEEDGCSQHRGKHSVVEHSRGIHTHKVEHDGSCKVRNKGNNSGTNVDAYSLIGR